MSYVRLKKTTQESDTDCSTIHSQVRRKLRQACRICSRTSVVASMVSPNRFNGQDARLRTYLQHIYS